MDTDTEYLFTFVYESGHNIFYKIACAPIDDSGKPAHPCSLIRVFARQSLGSQGSQPSSGGQRRLLSDCADAQADLSLRWAHMQSCRKCYVPADMQLHGNINPVRLLLR